MRHVLSAVPLLSFICPAPPGASFNKSKGPRGARVDLSSSPRAPRFLSKSSAAWGNLKLWPSGKAGLKIIFRPQEEKRYLNRSFPTGFLLVPKKGAWWVHEKRMFLKFLRVGISVTRPTRSRPSNSKRFLARSEETPLLKFK